MVLIRRSWGREVPSVGCWKLLRTKRGGLRYSPPGDLARLRREPRAVAMSLTSAKQCCYSLHKTVALHTESQRRPLRQTSDAEVNIGSIRERECHQVRNTQCGSNGQVVAETSSWSFLQSSSSIGFHDLTNISYQLRHRFCDFTRLLLAAAVLLLTLMTNDLGALVSASPD